MIVFFGCSKDTKKTKPHSKVLHSDCLNVQDKAKILELILTNNKVNKFLHLDLKGRLPVKIIENDFFNTIPLVINEESVIYTNNYEEHDDAIIVTLKDIDCRNKILKFNFFSKIENVSINGKAEFENKWIFNVLSVVEI